MAEQAEDDDTAKLKTVIPIVEEEVRVGKRVVEADRVIVRKTVHSHDETVEELLQTEHLEIERVPVNRIVTEPVASRYEGGVLVVPVLEEQLVVEKRLLLKEEVRIRRVTRTQPSRQTVRLRREEVTTGRHSVSESTERGGLRMAATPHTQGSTAGSTATGHDFQVVAMFDTYERARDARARLVEQGIPAADAELLDRRAAEAGSSAAYDRTDEGFWGAVKRFFLPEEDVRGYAEGLRRGHAMLVVRPPVGLHDRVTKILEEYDPIDLDTREKEWGKEGWTGDATMAAAPATPVAQAKAEVTGKGSALREGQEQVLPVVEEQVRVGKRQVSRGGVRARSYVLERPVQEDVKLREETVDVQRRPVDHPAEALTEDAFRERTIEVSAMGEEPVVAKTARVVEEVTIRKGEAERTETVRDTERRTEVKVEDDRTNKIAATPPKPVKP